MTEVARSAEPRVLVVGASGPIGRAVARVGNTMGLHIDSAARRGPIRLDVGDDALTEQVIAQTRPRAVVYLVTSAPPVESREVDVAVERMSALVRTAVAQGVERIVLASSAAVYGDGARTPLAESAELVGHSAYAKEKIASERALAALADELDFSAASLRIFNVFGEGCHGSLINALTAGPPPRLAMTSEFVRDYVHVDEVARAIVEAVARPEVRGAVNVGRGVAIDNLMLADAMPNAFHPVDLELESYSVADISRARAALDWSPEIDVLRYLEMLAAR